MPAKELIARMARTCNNQTIASIETRFN